MRGANFGEDVCVHFFPDLLSEFAVSKEVWDGLFVSASAWNEFAKKARGGGLRNVFVIVTTRDVIQVNTLNACTHVSRQTRDAVRFKARCVTSRPDARLSLPSV